MLLPHKHPFTPRIIREFHEDCLHGGAKLTEAVIRQQFWIPQGLSGIKAVLHKCVKCHRINPKPMSQYMADLPTPRVTPMQKPFTSVAVDYTGAVHVKITNGRGYKTKKAYIAIFVCMATKAMHIEAVTDMTAEAFIAAYRRLVSRHGVIRNIYSDNGTNFVGSNKILQENFENIDDDYEEIVCTELAKSGTQWHFSPPGAPHFNGLAEAAVKSVKLHIKKTIADTKLTFEELSTLLAQIEACVNSRPLCPLSTDPNDLSALTPAHFLVGESLIAPPEQNHLETKATWLTRWQKVQQMAQYFWKRWTADYLNQLQVRNKWNRQSNETLKLNDLVLIRDENLPPTQWLTGRVMETHPGTDGLTRVVTLRTKNSKMKRPVTKLCPLPINDCNKKVEEEISDEILVDASEEVLDETSDEKMNDTSNENVSVRTNITRVTARRRPIGILPVISAILALCTTFSSQTPIKNNALEVTKFNAAPGPRR